jgi:hypothetical protein
MGRMAEHQPRLHEAIAFFRVSPNASYITGAVLPVDGGWIAFGGAGIRSLRPFAEEVNRMNQTIGTNKDKTSMLTINLFNGLVYGALLIIMCSGLALIYGLRRVVNFAHGSLYMLGAYIGYSIAALPATSGLRWWPHRPSWPCFGVLLDRYGFRLLQDRDPLECGAGHLWAAAGH